MAAIGDGWTTNAWVEAGWVTASAPGGAWAVGAVAPVVEADKGKDAGSGGPPWWESGFHPPGGYPPIRAPELEPEPAPEAVKPRPVPAPAPVTPYDPFPGFYDAAADLRAAADILEERTAAMADQIRAAEAEAYRRRIMKDDEDFIILVSMIV